MEFGLGFLRHSSRDFWHLTLPELQAAIARNTPKHNEPLLRPDLPELMRQFPDRIGGISHEL